MVGRVARTGMNNLLMIAPDNSLRSAKSLVKPVNAMSMCVNMTYDPGPTAQDKPNSNHAGEEAKKMTEQYTIDRIDMGTGWVCFQIGETPPPIEQLPSYLNTTFYEWLQRNPEFKVRATMPIVEGGNTVAIHV